MTAAEIKALVADPRLRILQTSSPVESTTWGMLDDKFFSKRPDVELRVYGSGFSACDLSFLPHLRNVRRFAADSLGKAKGVKYLASLENVESLTVGIYSLEDFDFLEYLPSGRLRALSLGPTRSKRPSLRQLARFDQLRTLSIERQQKDIEVISNLRFLEDLTLRSIGIEGLDLLKGLDHLRSLRIQGGGIRELSALDGLITISYFQLWMVKGLSNISVISKMLGLQTLSLQSLRNVRSIPDLSRLTALRGVYLEDMRGLEDIRALTEAPALEQLIHWRAQGMEPSQYLDLLKSKTVKRLSVGFGSLKKNKALEELAAQAGIGEADVSEFFFS